VAAPPERPRVLIVLVARRFDGCTSES